MSKACFMACLAVDDCDKTLVFDLRLFLNAAGTGIFYGVLLYMLVVNRSEVISIFTGERRKDLQRQDRFRGSLEVSAWLEAEVRSSKHGMVVLRDG